ncbi:hypothetical protein ACFSJU_18215 [Paradesertivirga mongoliensis]|uniref:Uncharacterized protein n=1 Tax=Paradesertivirga mongoliensis TaxID=2100740 RepID=A0ABW4ZS53_9SPHI|nr:hypothetical protein [Pedobacter mongoliensis]
MKINRIFFSTVIVACIGTLGQAKAQSNFNPEYKLDRVVYNISDDKIREVLENEKEKTAFKKAQSLNKQTFKKEIERIESLVKLKVNPNFDKNQIKFQVDTTSVKNRFSVVTLIAKND